MKCEASNSKNKKMTLAEVVRSYKKNERKCAKRTLKFFAEQCALSKAIRYAGRAIVCWCGKKACHQHRIPNETLEAFAKKLLGCQRAIAKVVSFDDLYEKIKKCQIKGIGELAVYDTAVRIGVKLSLSPQKVYLHAGTLEGAKKLGIKGAKNGVALPKSDFPKEFRSLKCREIEDCLCIYRKEF